MFRCSPERRTGAAAAAPRAAPACDAGRPAWPARRRALGTGAALAVLGAPLAVALLATPPPAAAAPARVEPFGADTWKRLQAELPRPGLVVFTATWCPTCPEVLRKLADVRRANRLASPLVAVVMDTDDEPALLADAHYRVADRLFAFDGEEAALRRTVQPQWRGVTPFVVLLPAAGAPLYVTGMPTGAQLAQWLRR